MVQDTNSYHTEYEVLSCKRNMHKERVVETRTQVEDLSHLGTWDLGPGSDTCLTDKDPEGQKAEQLPRILVLGPWPEKIRGASHSPPGEEDHCQ